MSKEIKTVAIVGLGALGILFGHHLSKKMPFDDLRIIANQNRIDRYKRIRFIVMEKFATSIM